MTWTTALRTLPAQANIAFRGTNGTAFLPAGGGGGGDWSGVYFGSTTDHSIGYIDAQNGVCALWTATLPAPLNVVFATGTSYGDPTISSADKAVHLRQQAVALGLAVPNTGQIMTDLGAIGYGYVGPDSDGTRELILGHNLIAQPAVPINGATLAYVQQHNYEHQGWSPNQAGPFNQPTPANQTGYIATMV